MTTQTLARLTDVDPLVHSVRASTGKRLGAVAVDAVVPVALGAAVVVFAIAGYPAAAVIAGVLALGVLALTLVAIARTGRSLGALATETRVVVKDSGTPAQGRLIPALFSGRLGTYDVRRGRDPFAPALSPFRFAEQAARPATVIAGPRRAPVLELDSHERLTLDSALVIGRNPSAPADAPAALFQWPDLSRTLSKSHVRVEWDGKDVWAIDLGSTNGTFLHLAGGAPVAPAPVPLVPYRRTVLPPGATLQLGDRLITVRTPS